MKKLKGKLLSLLMSLVLVFNMTCPIFASAKNQTDQKLGYIEGKTPQGYITLSVEKFTLGLGYIQEPIIVPYYEGDNGAKVVDRVIGSENYQATGDLESTFYISSIKDDDYRTENIPTYILEKLSSDPTYRKKDGWLSAFDYTQMSGWMYTVANDFLNVAVAQYDPEDGAVMRWQFTVYGYGEDLGSSWGSIKTADKDKLTTAVAKINSADNKTALLSNVKIRKAYDKANNILTNMESTQEEVDSALKSLESTLTQSGVNDNINTPSPSVDEAVASTGTFMINTVPEPAFGTTAGEWTVLSLARGNISVPQNYYEDYYERIEEKVKSVSGVLDKRKYTEYSRLILALSSIGKDATDVAGYNMVAPLADYSQTIWQGINGPIFALIALDTRNYEIPTAPEGKEQATREKYIEYILSKEIKTGTDDAGGWALTGTAPDPDMTGMALQALAPYKDDEKVAPYIERALEALFKIQKDSGGYASWGTENSESIAQVIVALCTLDIDITTDTRFIKEKNWLISSIMEFYCEGGGFKHTLDSTVNAMATDQAMYALVAYQRFLQGKNSLYDMTDSIGMSLDDVTIQKNESKKLQLKIEGNYTPKDIYWASDDDRIVTVSQDGTIEGVGVGTTKVYAYVNGQTISCNVNVECKLTGVKLNKTELALDLGKTAILSATPLPADAMGETTVRWKSEDESIATVDGNGLVVAVSAGTTNIVAQIGEFTAKCSVTVNIPITNVTINPSTAKISVNGTIQLSVITEPENATVDKTVTWTTSSSSIATVDKNGVVTGKKAGTTNIYGKVGGKSAYCKVTVISTDEETANSVMEKINEIGDVTLENKSEIEAIRSAYESLTEEQKKYVTNLDKLLVAEEKISNLEIEKVKNIISKLPDEITLKDEDDVKEARKAYDSLTKEQQTLLNTDLTNNINKIKNAENTIISIKAVNQAFADKVAKYIDNIDLSNGYSDKNKADVLSAKSMYDSLSEDQKLLINNSLVSKLNNSLEKIKELEISNFVSLVEQIQRPALEEDLNKAVEAISAYGNMDDSIKNNDKVKSAKFILDEIVSEIGKDKVNKETAEVLVKEFVNLQLPLKSDRSTVEKAKMLVNNYESLNSQAKKYFNANTSGKDTYNKVLLNLELISKADEFDNKVKESSLIVTNKNQLEEAKKLLSDFDKLDNDVQNYLLTLSQINNLKDLVLKGEADVEAATKVDNLINKIPSKITKNDYKQIREVKASYDKLTKEQKNYVENIDKLNNAVSQLKDEFDNDLSINNIKYNSTTITGKGQGGAKVQAYVGTKLIGSSVVLADGTYSMKISGQTGGTKITVKMTKDGYITQESTKIVLKQIKTFTVNRIKPNDKVVTGKGIAGAIVRIYSDDKEIGKATVGKDGKYSVKIPAQKLYTEITVKISKIGYYTTRKTTTVLNVFTKTLTVNTVKSTSTKISGKGQSGATVRAYVNGKQIGKAVKVSKTGTYSISIPKQKKNTKITIKMSKTATASVSKEINVK